MKLLLVDDNQLLNELFGTFLRSKGHTVSSLAEPLDTIAWLKTHPYDALIIDPFLPDRDFINFVKEDVRPIYPALPIIFFTGINYDEELMQLCRKAGGTGYVHKGLGPDQIYQTIMGILS